MGKSAKCRKMDEKMSDEKVVFVRNAEIHEERERTEKETRKNDSRITLTASALIY